MPVPTVASKLEKKSSKIKIVKDPSTQKLYKAKHIKKLLMDQTLDSFCSPRDLSNRMNTNSSSVSFKMDQICNIKQIKP